MKGILLTLIVCVLTALIMLFALRGKKHAHACGGGVNSSKKPKS